MTRVVKALDHRVTNADLMVDCRDLGYIGDGIVLDPTFGRGTFWKLWRPAGLVGTDLDPAKSETGVSVSCTALPYGDGSVECLVLDLPYKLNGTPDGIVDERYGVHRATSRDGRHALMFDGITEAARVLRPASVRPKRLGGVLLFKCQDQVNGGKVRWQTRMMADHGEAHGFELVDSLLFVSYRKQPSDDDEDAVQEHARRNVSTLLVFRRDRSTQNGLALV